MPGAGSANCPSSPEKVSGSNSSGGSVNSKDRILSDLRDQQLPAAELPNLDHAWIRYEDLAAQFTALVESVGGRVVRLPSRGDLRAALAEIPAFTGARQIVSGVAEIEGNVEMAMIDDPHALETVDFAIFPGEFAVAENGAVWVTDRQVRHRAIYFITQHLALVVQAAEIVNNLHEAYARIALGASSLGVFISGPSKTADIEQSLVIGAHGPRSLTVFLVG
jgi:L-lactate dehydrogenase complex protein LldG